MRPAPEFQTIRPGLYFWQACDPSVKTDLCCCALDSPEGLIFCDPVPLDPPALDELLAGRAPRAILLTNGNHARNAPALARRFNIDIWAHSGAKSEVPATRWFQEGDTLPGALEPIALDGFAPGETALWRDGLLLLGDAIINLPPYGFSILPDKYCANPKAGRQSLKKLKNLPVETLTFAHGLPIVTNARDRLATLIA